MQAVADAVVAADDDVDGRLIYSRIPTKMIEMTLISHEVKINRTGCNPMVRTKLHAKNLADIDRHRELSLVVN